MLGNSRVCQHASRNDKVLFIGRTYVCWRGGVCANLVVRHQVLFYQQDYKFHQEIIGAQLLFVSVESFVICVYIIYVSSKKSATLRAKALAHKHASSIG